MSLPPLASLELIQARLNRIFPTEFPDRRILVGIMAVKLVAAAIYGGFITGRNRYFRPSMITNFNDVQFGLVTDDEREEWAVKSSKPKFVHLGTPWYANNTRETLRDDLIRNRLVPLGIIGKLEGYAPTHPAPIYCFAPSFIALFDPALNAEPLDTAITAWRTANLNPTTLRRMNLLASGVIAKTGSVDVALPTTGRTLRLTAGEASLITKDVCEVLAPAFVRQAVVIHVSLSDKKIFPELADEAAAVGLTLNTSLELPDVIFVDSGTDPMKLVFVEVVHSDGPVTEVRADALMKIATSMGFDPADVTLVTAFEDRGAEAFRRRFSEIAVGSWIWFRSEPHLYVQMRTTGLH